MSKIKHNISFILLIILFFQTQASKIIVSSGKHKASTSSKNLYHIFLAAVILLCVVLCLLYFSNSGKTNNNEHTNNKPLHQNNKPRLFEAAPTKTEIILPEKIEEIINSLQNTLRDFNAKIMFRYIAAIQSDKRLAKASDRATYDKVIALEGQSQTQQLLLTQMLQVILDTAITSESIICTLDSYTEITNLISQCIQTLNAQIALLASIPQTDVVEGIKSEKTKKVELVNKFAAIMSTLQSMAKKTSSNEI